MGKKEDKKNSLLKAFKEEGSLSTSQIMELLATSSKGTVNSYIHYLKDDGHEFEEIISPHGAKNYILKSASDMLDYKEITTHDWQDFVILSSLSDALFNGHRVSRKSLIQYIHDEKELNIGLKKSALFNRINELCKNGIISENSKTNPIMLFPGMFLPLIRPLRFSDARTIVKKLLTVPGADPFYHSLNTIKNDILELSDTLSSSERSLSYVFQGKGYREDTIEEQIQKHFGKCDYRKHLCEITYKNKDDGKNEVIQVGIGLIVYSVEKDRIYVIGKRQGKDSGASYIILNIERIVDIKTARIKRKPLINPFWMSREFQIIFDEMLSISTEQAQKVLVRFDDEYYVETRLEGLKKTRDKASFKKEGGRINYTDSIRGTSDLRNFLRSFGDKCVVISPINLRDEMKNNTKENLDLYEKK